MSTAKTGDRNWFDQGGEAYARFRPSYPDQLTDYLAGTVADHSLAVDVGCGTGQLTRQLAGHFDAVLGLDASADQVANAAAREGVAYGVAPAEDLPLGDRTASLVTVGQAAHWFDLPAFYTEFRRVSRKTGVLALVSYGVPCLEGRTGGVFADFYGNRIGPYWPAERRLVDSGYADIDFPFHELEKPALHIRLDWNLAELLGYVSTWSAVRHAREAGEERLLLEFASNMGSAWGDPAARHAISWPINLRVGRR